MVLFEDGKGKEKSGATDAMLAKIKVIKFVRQLNFRFEKEKSKEKRKTKRSVLLAA